MADFLIKSKFMQLSQKIKSVVKSILQENPSISNQISLFLRRFNADTLAREISSKTGTIPNIIPIRLPEHINLKKTFKLHTASGKDQIAGNLWFLGWYSFEKPVPDVFSACASEGSGIIIDVGANTGFYSLLAVYSSKQLKIHAFEPYLPVKEIFENNISLNKIEHRIEVFNYAVSDQSGEAELYVPLLGHGLIETSCSLNKEFKDSHSSVVKVPLITLDEHIKQHGIKRVEILKIDVESFEHKVLKGATNLLREQRPVIFFEVLPSANVAVLEEIRKSNRYIAIRLHSDLAVIGKEVAYDPLTWNHLLIPEEKLKWLQDIFMKIKLNFEKI